MPDRILIDSGPLIALFHSGDNHHKKVRNFLAEKKYLFISTLAIFTEVSYFLSANIKAQRDFFDWVMYKGVIISDINQHDIPRLIELTEKYSDLPMDFADATLVKKEKKTGIHQIISLDSDFEIYRLPGREKIQNVYKGE
jgi:predicted nucleic acid-binding protein